MSAVEDADNYSVVGYSAIRDPLACDPHLRRGRAILRGAKPRSNLSQKSMSFCNRAGVIGRNAMDPRRGATRLVLQPADQSRQMAFALPGVHDVGMLAGLTDAPFQRKIIRGHVFRALGHTHEIRRVQPDKTFFDHRGLPMRMRVMEGSLERLSAAQGIGLGRNRPVQTPLGLLLGPNDLCGEIDNIIFKLGDTHAKIGVLGLEIGERATGH